MRLGFELLPLHVGGWSGPILLDGLGIGVGDHVRQLRQVGAGDGLAEKDAGHAGAGEHGDLAVIEHLHLVQGTLLVGVFVGAKFKHARLGLGRGNDLSEAVEGVEQRAFIAYERGIGFTRHEDVVPGDLESRVGGEVGFQCDDRLERLVRQH